MVALVSSLLSSPLLSILLIDLLLMLPPGQACVTIIEMASNHLEPLAKAYTWPEGEAGLGGFRVSMAVHSAFRIPTGGVYMMPLTTANLLFHRLLAADLIVIDEMSMLTSQLFAHVFSRLTDACGDNPLKNKVILLVGDHYQLPAVCHHFRGEYRGRLCEECHLSNSSEWSNIQWHHLRHSVRQARDPGFLDFLNIIRTTVPTQEQVDAALGSCMIGNAGNLAWAGVKGTVLCTHNEDVDHYNNGALQLQYPHALLRQNCSVIEDVLPGYKDDPQVVQHRNNLKQDRLQWAAQGAKVVLKRNINVPKGAVNNASGVILGFKKHAGVMVGINIRLDNGYEFTL